MKKILIIGMLVITGLSYANDSEGRERVSNRVEEFRMEQSLNNNQIMDSRARVEERIEINYLENLERMDRGSDR